MVGGGAADDGSADVVGGLLGWWQLVAGGAVDPVPPDLDTAPTVPRSSVDLSDDGRTSDQGCLVHFGLSASRPWHGGLTIEVGGRTTVSGGWRASPDGVFLARASNGHGPLFGERHRPRPWLSAATSVVLEERHMMLRDQDGELAARFERLPDPTDRTDPAAADAVQGTPVARPRGLPAGLVPADQAQLLDAWESVHLAHPATSMAPRGVRWQNLEFRGDGYWHAFPIVNVGGGLWRAGPAGTLLVIRPYGRTARANSAWLDLDRWLLPVARAGFDPDHGHELVLLDDHNHELQRLQQLTDPHRFRDYRPRTDIPDPGATGTP